MNKILRNTWTAFKIIVIIYAILIFSSVTFFITFTAVGLPFSRTRVYADCSDGKFEQYGKTVDIICFDSDKGREIHEKCFLEK